MVTVIARRSDGLLLSWARGGVPADYDPSTQVALTLADPPTTMTGWRWDGATQVRAATVPEQAAALDDEADREATRRFETDRALKALVRWCAQRFGITPAQARSELLTLYRSLG